MGHVFRKDGRRGGDKGLPSLEKNVLGCQCLAYFFNPSAIYAKIIIAHSGCRSDMDDRRFLNKMEFQIIHKAKKPGGNSDVEVILGLSDDVYTPHGLKDK